MEYKTDIQIAQECQMAPIVEIAEKAGIDENYLEQYGKYKAKISLPKTGSCARMVGQSIKKERESK